VPSWRDLVPRGGGAGDIPDVWFGHVTVQLTIHIRPARGRTLELVWGSKADVREAVVKFDDYRIRGSELCKLEEWPK
jgi:hypothetical protein